MRERISINEGTNSYYQTMEVYYGDDFTTSETRFQFKGMWDVETPNFHERMNSGEIINNPMYYVSQDLNSFFSTFGFSSIAYNGVSQGPFWVRQTHFAGPPKLTDTPSIDTFLETYESERQVAINKAWTNVDVSEIQALASIGEMPETLRWLASLTGRMISILRAFQQRRVIRNGIKLFTSPKGTIITAAEFWLEFRYAIRPLIFECAQATNAMQANLMRNSRITARGSNSVTEASDELVVTREMPNGYASQAPIECTVTRSSKYRAGVLYDIGSDINGLTALWGLDQPLESVWELVPFSFIIDWFFNVGSTIAAWTVNPNLTALTSWVTEHHTFTTGLPRIENPTYYAADQHKVDPNWWAYGAYCNTTGSVPSVTLIKRRTVCPPRAILPTFNIRLDVAKLIDLAAIGQALFRGLRK